MTRREVGWLWLVVIWIGGLLHIFDGLHLFESKYVLLGGLGSGFQYYDWLFWLPGGRYLLEPLMKLLRRTILPGYELNLFSVPTADHTLYVISLTIYLLIISALIYILLIRKKSRDGTSTARKALS